MSKIQLQLPTIQNWSCHSCGGCCRQHLIAITQEEHDRIVQQNWTAEDGIPEGQPVVEKNRGSKHNPYRLAHQPDGACVFLRDDGLCRIHAKFGEPAKPLACRVYPYAFHPKGNKVAVGVRFSCPSVVSNLGTSLVDNRADIQELANRVVPDEYRQSRPPRVKPGESLDWRDILTLVEMLDGFFDDDNEPFLLQLLRAFAWANLIQSSTFAKISGDRVQELADLFRIAAREEWPDLPEVAEPSSSLGRVMFRLLISIYCRKETLRDLDSPLRSRMTSLASTMKFAWGGGKTPALSDDFPAVAFSRIEQLRGDLPAGTDELFRRYVRMKIQGMHFCGAAFYDYPLTTGFFSLSLMVPVILWMARWIAVGKGDETVSQEILELALATADHHHGYSPVLGMAPFRKRVEYLHSLGELPKLIVNYAR
jgi:lysine-N-methylase